MLFELSGIACVLNVKRIKEGFTKIQVIGSKSIKQEDDSHKDISGARWINLSGKQADWWFENFDRVKNSIVSFSAQAETSDDGNYYENYRINNFDDLNIVAWPDNADGVRSALMNLKGTGRVINVHPMGQGFTKIQVINSETYKGRETKSTRWINLSGGQADWWAANIEKVVKSHIEFRATVITSKKQDGDQTLYFDNYRADRVDIINWAQPKAQANQPQQHDQSMNQAPQTGFAPHDAQQNGGYASVRQ